MNKYPSLVDSRELRALFGWLCFSTFHDEDSGRLVVARSKLAAHIAPEKVERAFHVGALLREMQAKALPELRWSGYSPADGKAREILNDGFDATMVAALDAELRLPFDKDFTGMINFVTGRRVDKARLYPMVEEHRKLIREANLTPTQSTILDYLDALDGHRLFLPKLAKNKEAIDTEIAKLPEHVQIIQRRILHAVMEQPQMLYRPGDRTCRLSQCGDGVLGLKREVRKALCAGWTDCDLRSSQFSILATTLNAPISKALIESGKTLWRSLYLFTHDVDADPPKEIKAIFKEVVYSVAFGKLASNLARLLRPHGLERLLGHPVLQELLQLRDEWFARIESGGGAPDIWGTWHSIRAEKDCARGEEARLPRHIAATVIQSWEMEIIAPIFTVAKRYGETYQFRIVLFQHDGATISFHAHDVRKERAMTLLRDAVETRARELGVQTTLEFADLEAADVPSVVRSQDQSVEEIVAELEDGLRAAGLFLPPEQCDFCGGEGDWYEGEYAGHWCCDLHAHLVDEADDAIKASSSEEHIGPAFPKVEQPCLFL